MGHTFFGSHLLVTPILGHTLFMPHSRRVTTSLGHPSLGHPSLGHPSLGHPTLGHTFFGSPFFGSHPLWVTPSLGHPSLGHTHFGSLPLHVTHTVSVPLFWVTPVLGHTHFVLGHTRFGSHPLWVTPTLGHTLLPTITSGYPFSNKDLYWLTSSGLASCWIFCSAMLLVPIRLSGALWWQKQSKKEELLTLQYNINCGRSDSKDV